MTFSVNTNTGAVIALQSLNRTNRSLDAVQKRVSTGFRVADAIDDGAAFAVAQGLRGLVKGNEATNERLTNSKNLLGVTAAALNNVSEQFNHLRVAMIKLADDSVVGRERTAYVQAFLSARDAMYDSVAAATYNGQNALITNTAINPTVPVIDMNARIALIFTMPGVTAADFRNNYIGPGGTLATFETTLNTHIATIGAASRQVENQSNFLSIQTDAIEMGIANIVDADLAKDSARLQSYQIRQQLGTQMLSIANKSPSIILSLFQ